MGGSREFAPFPSGLIFYSHTFQMLNDAVLFSLWCQLCLWPTHGTLVEFPASLNTGTLQHCSLVSLCSRPLGCVLCSILSFIYFYITCMWEVCFEIPAFGQLLPRCNFTNIIVLLIDNFFMFGTHSLIL